MLELVNHFDSSERAGLADWDARYLEPVPDLAIIRRMLNNLQRIYLGARDWPRLLRTANQILVVTPEDHDEHFTRALALAGCEAREEAIVEFELYLALRPDSEHRSVVLHFLEELKRASSGPRPEDPGFRRAP